MMKYSIQGKTVVSFRTWKLEKYKWATQGRAARQFLKMQKPYLYSYYSIIYRTWLPILSKGN